MQRESKCTVMHINFIRTKEKSVALNLFFFSFFKSNNAKNILLSEVCHHTGDFQPVIKCSETVQGPDCPMCRWCV